MKNKELDGKATMPEVEVEAQKVFLQIQKTAQELQDLKRQVSVLKGNLEVDKATPTVRAEVETIRSAAQEVLQRYHANHLNQEDVTWLVNFIQGVPKPEPESVTWVRVAKRAAPQILGGLLMLLMVRPRNF